MVLPCQIYSFGSLKPDKHLVLHRTGFFWCCKYLLTRIQVTLHYATCIKENHGRNLWRYTAHKGRIRRDSEAFVHIRVSSPVISFSYHSKQRKSLSTHGISRSHHLQRRFQPEQSQVTHTHSYQLLLERVSKSTWTRPVAANSSGKVLWPNQLLQECIHSLNQVIVN